MRKTSAVWKYVKNGKCQVKKGEKSCDESVGTTNTGNVWRHFERVHKELFAQMKAEEKINESIQPKLDAFVNVKSGPLKDLALLFATSTAPMSMLKNDRFKASR